jgi:hypothetical protein
MRTSRVRAIGLTYCDVLRGLTEHSPDIEILEQKRQAQDMDAIYIVAPLPYIVDCIMADFERGRYRRSWLLFTSSKIAYFS